MVILQDIGRRREDGEAMQQQVTEIRRVQRLQAFLIFRIETDGAPIGKISGFPGRDLIRRQALVFPALDQSRQRPCRPPLLVDIRGLQMLFQQADLVVHIENGEVGPQTHDLRVTAQNTCAESMKSAEPHAFHHTADLPFHPVAHLPGRLVGEGHGEDLVRPRLALMEQMREARRQHPRLAGAGAGEHEDRPVERLHGLPLRLIQRIEDRWSRGRPGGTRRNR